MFFHPRWDVRQAAWDPCSYRWIIWSKWELELCVIRIAMVWETMCLYDGTQWCSVCGEEEGSKNWSLRIPSDQLMFCGYLPSPGHLERPAIEIWFKPAKWNPGDAQWWESGHEDQVVNSVITITRGSVWECKRKSAARPFSLLLVYTDFLLHVFLDLEMLSFIKLH